MKTFIIWLVLLFLLLGYGLSTKYELILAEKQLTLTQLDYWGLKTSLIYHGPGIERFEFGEDRFPMVRGRVRYNLKLYDPNGAVIPLPRVLCEVYGIEKVKSLTSNIKVGVDRGHFKRTGYAHRMFIALGVFPLIFTMLYGAAYVKNRHKEKANQKQ